MQTWGKGFADGQGYVVIGQKWLEPNLCSLPKCSRLCCPWSEVVRAKGNYSLVCGPKYLLIQGVGRDKVGAHRLPREEE